MKRLLAAARGAAANAGISVPGGGAGGGGDAHLQQQGAYDPNAPLAGRTIVVASSSSSDLDLDNNDSSSSTTTLTLRVEDALGSGGFSTIYRAREVGDASKTVALKHVRTGGGGGGGGGSSSNGGDDFDGRALADAETEVSAMRAAGRHPHLLPLRAVGYARDGAPCAAPKKNKNTGGEERAPTDVFIVTELCGESLADALRFVDYYTRRLALMCDVALQLPVGIQVPPPPPPPPRPRRAAAREVLNWGGA